MNEIGAYDDVDMRGIDPTAYESHVAVEAQKRLIAAIPEMRIIWNAGIGKFQSCFREPGKVQPFYDGGACVLVGWLLVGGQWSPPLDIDRVIRQLLKQQEINVDLCRKAGFENVSDYAAHLADEIVKKRQQETSDKFDEFLGIHADTGYVAPIHNGSFVSRPFSLTSNVFKAPKDLPMAPAALDRAAMPAQRIKREAVKLDAALREGAPL